MIMENLGVMPAVVTPMLEDGVTLNEKAFVEILEDQIAKGVGSLLILGGTGEGTAVARPTRKQVLELAVKTVNHRKPVVMGVVDLSVYDAIQDAKLAKECGADMILVAPPFGRGTTTQACIEFYQAIDKAVDMPILIYNFPGRYGDNGYFTSPDTIEALLDAVPNIIGIKECCCKLEVTIELIKRFGERMQVLSGNEYLAPWEMLCGAKGVICASGNVLCKEWVEIYDYAMKGDVVKVTDLGYRIQKLCYTLFKSQNPGPIKYLMGLQGFDAGLPLAPCPQVPDAVKALVKAEAEKIGVI